MFPPNDNRVASLSSWFPIFAIALCVALVTPANGGEVPGADDIVVVRVSGDVRVTMRGEPRAVQPGTPVDLPATVRTGPDGAIDLRQANTTVAIAADTELELPATADRGAMFDRLIQSRGSAFYDVGKHGSRKLRVETPYLVAVIKGTQFNVVVQEDSSTISLFEGRLEVRAPDDSDVIDLNAGEIAIRHATDKAIRVLRMDGAKPPVSTSNDGGRRSFTPDDPEGGTITPLPAGPTDDVGDLVVGRDPTIHVIPPTGDSIAQIDVHTDAATAEVSLEANAGALDVEVATNVGEALAVQIDAGIDAAGAGVDADAGAQIDLGVAAVDMGVGATADLGPGTLDVGAGAGADLAVASVDSGLDVGADLGAGTVDATVDVGADLGAAAVDAGLDADLDPGSASVDAGLDAAVAGTDVGVDVGLDVGSGDLGLDVELGGLDVGLGSDPADQTTTPTNTPAPDTDDGGLLGGLLGGRRGN